jgi:hypothetical protein
VKNEVKANQCKYSINHDNKDKESTAGNGRDQSQKLKAKHLPESSSEFAISIRQESSVDRPGHVCEFYVYIKEDGVGWMAPFFYPDCWTHPTQDN